MVIDFRRWAVVAHKDDTGFGRQAADMRAVLGLGGHIVVPSERLADHPLDPGSDVPLRPDDPVEKVERALAGRQGIVFFERSNWHPALLRTARRLGVRTVCVPNWEWFRPGADEWADCDLFVCTSRFSETVVRRSGWRNTVRLPWTLDLARFPARRIAGPARRFVHNAGLVDLDDRKSTRDVIAAFMRVAHPGVRLLVRLQKAEPLPAHDDRVEVRVGNLAEPAELWATGDCAIQPSKMEGQGFMVLEPWVSGLPVITLDYPPMNETVTDRRLLVAKRWFRRRAFPSAWVPHAHLRLPRIGDLAKKIAWCASHDLAPVAAGNRAQAERDYAPERLREAWTRALGALLPPDEPARPIPAT
ncbi:MAG TPA: glycosyltransferase [Opitutus sp.]|nr:glycosyltransferase [Opitutus sp.]